MKRACDSNWRPDAIASCKQRLREAISFADRAALARELTRLEGGRLVLEPELASGFTDLPGLHRFGLSAHQDGQFLTLFDNLRAYVHDDELQSCLKPDFGLRRHFTLASADLALRRFSGHEQYTTPTQKAALRALVTMPPGTSLLVTMSTGAGKSVLFQVGVRYWRSQERETLPCAAIIVPTVALALDHERTSQQLEGLEASRAITGDMRDETLMDILHAFIRGEVPLLFLSPELAFGRCRTLLFEAARVGGKPLAAKGRLDAIFIDEAHIIESWGRSFRPDFQRLGGLVHELTTVNPQLRCVLLSATISDSAREVLHRSYAGNRPHLEVDAVVPRYEFDIYIQRFSSPDERLLATLSLVDYAPRPAIIYTTLVKDAARLHERLQKSGYERIALFTGDSQPEARRNVMRAWQNNHLDLVVATSAFGMGVDKSDVRTVIHACLPEDAARYYQEIGRAGRDGHQAFAACLYHKRPAQLSRMEAGRDDTDYALGIATSGWIKLKKAELRWRAILDQSTLSIDECGARILHIPLDARHEELGRHTGEHNRDWNRMLINLLQRARAVEVLVANEAAEDDIWDTKILDVDLLSPQTAKGSLIRCLERRDAEQAHSSEKTRTFINIVRNQDFCTLSGIFEIIETGMPMSPPCGRCPWCRKSNSRPPVHLHFGGTSKAWSAPPNWASCSLQPGIFLLHPNDPTFVHGCGELIGRLVAAGFEQYVVPQGLGNRCLEELAKTTARLGFVIEANEFLDQQWVLANLPTAVLLQTAMPKLDYLLQSVLRMVSHDQTMLLVTAPGAEFGDGRLIDQVISRRAPLNERNIRPRSCCP